MKRLSGRSGLKRWIYGSIANRVLRGVNCPLLLLHDPQTPVDACGNLSVLIAQREREPS